MTPVQIETLLHIYYRCESLPNTQAVKDAVEVLIHFLLITTDVDKCGYKCTDRGHAFVEMLKATPLPEWKDPRTAG